MPLGRGARRVPRQRGTSDPKSSGPDSPPSPRTSPPRRRGPPARSVVVPVVGRGHIALGPEIPLPDPRRPDEDPAIREEVGDIAGAPTGPDVVLVPLPFHPGRDDLPP